MRLLENIPATVPAPLRRFKCPQCRSVTRVEELAYVRCVGGRGHLSSLFIEDLWLRESERHRIGYARDRGLIESFVHSFSMPLPAPYSCMSPLTAVTLVRPLSDRPWPPRGSSGHRPRGEGRGRCAIHVNTLKSPLSYIALP